jgi:hypothetical protein
MLHGVDDGLDRLLSSLSSLGSDGLSLPSETVGLVLSEAKRNGMPWQLAWNTAINNVAAPAKGGYTDPAMFDAIAEDRALLGECKPAFRAAYEGDAEVIDRDTTIAAARAAERLADVDVPTRAEFPSLRAIAPPPVNGNGARMRDAA